MIQEIGNTVLIIEHDMDIVKNVDYILDIGPNGGSKGGQIVAIGWVAELKSASERRRRGETARPR